MFITDDWTTNEKVLHPGVYNKVNDKGVSFHTYCLCIYMNELLRILNKHGLACLIEPNVFGSLWYADDLIMVSTCIMTIKNAIRQRIWCAVQSHQIWMYPFNEETAQEAWDSQIVEVHWFSKVLWKRVYQWSKWQKRCVFHAWPTKYLYHIMFASHVPYTRSGNGSSKIVMTFWNLNLQVWLVGTFLCYIFQMQNWETVNWGIYCAWCAVVQKRIQQVSHIGELKDYLHGGATCGIVTPGHK